MPDAIRHLNIAAQQFKELIAERDACLERVKRAEQKRVDQKAEMEREISKIRTERDKLLRIVERMERGNG